MAVITSWSAHTHGEIVRRRAGGRNRYNARRRLAAMVRRIEVQRIIQRLGGLDRGNRAAIARELEISEATVSRDVHALLYSGTVCEHCGHLRKPSLRIEP